LAGDFLPDLLDVVEELVKTTQKLADAQGDAGGAIGGWKIDGQQFGFNSDSKYNIFEEDGNLVVFRDNNGIINIIIANGGNGFIDTRVDGYEGILTFGSGEGIEIYVNQSN